MIRRLLSLVLCKILAPNILYKPVYYFGVRKMSNDSMSFVQQFNHISSKMEWKVVRDDYDYNQEIATSCYGDMLHDTERNQKFGLALKKAITEIHNSGRMAHVLDIGTGTGLLSMLAIKYGADSVVACEAFLPMADCAVKVIEQNGLSDRITVIKKHSTALTVGNDGDMKQKANILVSEVFDTELIGEGAIKTFNHAHKYLLEEYSIVIPSAGTIYAQIVESDLASNWNQITDWHEGNKILVRITDEIKGCPGAASVHDIQLSQFDQSKFRALTDVVPVFEFDWLSNEEVPKNRQSNIRINCIESGKAQVVLMWWDLKMDPSGEIMLSCAPTWCHPDLKGKNLSEWCPRGNAAKYIPWRDHWMQAVYFLKNKAEVTRNLPITLTCHHDEFSFWFDLEKSVPLERKITSRPVCHCGVHFSLSRTRIGAINSSRRRSFYLESLKDLVRSDISFAVFGDMSLLGFLIGRLGAKNVSILETSPPLWKAMKRIAEFNGLDNVEIYTSISEMCKSLDVKNLCIVSEPFFRNSVLPWDNITFWYTKENLVRTIRALKPGLTSPYFTVSPSKSKMIACAVQFDDLWKIARRLNKCEGFDMKHFDDLIDAAKAKAESYVEAQPLWEYPAKALTPPFCLFEFNFSEGIPDKTMKNEGRIFFPSNCCCDGIAIWMEYCMKGDYWLSTGPMKNVILNEYITWDMFERQGVHLFRTSKKVNQSDHLDYEVSLAPESGELAFKFRITSTPY